MWASFKWFCAPLVLNSLLSTVNCHGFRSNTGAYGNGRKNSESLTAHKSRRPVSHNAGQRASPLKVTTEESLVMIGFPYESTFALGQAKSHEDKKAEQGTASRQKTLSGILTSHHRMSPMRSQGRSRAMVEPNSKNLGARGRKTTAHKRRRIPARSYSRPNDALHGEIVRLRRSAYLDNSQPEWDGQNSKNENNHEEGSDSKITSMHQRSGKPHVYRFGDWSPLVDVRSPLGLRNPTIVVAQLTYDLQSTEDQLMEAKLWREKVKRRQELVRG